MSKAPNLGAIIVAAGTSQRMGGLNKAFAPLGNKPLLAWSVDTCQECQLVSRIAIALRKDDLASGQKLARQRGWTKVSRVYPGGRRRQDSVKRGLPEMAGCDWVMVHDGARPFLTLELIQDGLEAARETGAAIAAVPVTDTIKLSSDAGLIEETLSRDKLWLAQTPQIFGLELLTRAYKKLTAEATDDASAVERLGYKVKLYRGSYRNIKVTTPADLVLAEVIASSDESGHRL